MPLLTPSSGQSESEFVNSCMSNTTMKKEFPDNKQRVAVCYSQWKNYRVKKAKKQFVKKALQLISRFIKYGNQ